MSVNHYSAKFEHRVYVLFQEGHTAKPMTDILRQEFPEYELTYSKVNSYIDDRRDKLREIKRIYQEQLEKERENNAELTAKRVHGLEQDTLAVLEVEIQRCRLALKGFQPWDKQHASITNTLTKLLAQVEKLGRTGMVRKVEEASAVAKVKEKAKGNKQDPLLAARSTQGKVV